MADIKHALNGNIEITFSLPWSSIHQAYDAAVDQAVAQSRLEGFRPGKAPRHLVEPKLDKNKLYSSALQHLLPQTYSDIIKQFDLHPLLNPRISITSGQPGQDWQFTAITCEAPPVNLSFPLSPPRLMGLNTLIDHLRAKAAVKVPDLLVEEEANHRLSALIDNITRLGLSLDSYLSTKKLTPESLKAATITEARLALEVEFVLNTVQQAQKLPDRKSVLDFLQKLI